MNDVRKNLRRVFWFFFAMFAFLAIYLIKLVTVDAEGIASNPYNRRLNSSDAAVVRGAVYDANGAALAKSDGSVREYPYGAAFSHIIGYTSRGKAGLEQFYNFKLQTLNNEIIQRIINIATGEKLMGNSIVTTLDSETQQLAYKLLGGNKGAAVVMEPSTGRILAMVSSPGFNPNTVSDDWEGLTQNDEGALVNRATQGLYPPGSIFKMIVAAAALEAGIPDFEFECTGTAAFGEDTIRCSDAKAHGTVSLKRAMEVSCNAYFASLGEKVGAEGLIAMAERFYFNKQYGYPLEYNISRFTLPTEPSVGELIQTSIGQGKTLATPLNMVMAVSAIGNGGMLMTPYIVDSLADKNGNTVKKFYPQALAQVVSAETADSINEMLIGVVINGTGRQSAIDGVTVAGKTGTAQNESGKDHSWYVCYAPAEKPEYAVAIVIEQTGGGSKAVSMAGQILEHMLKGRVQRQAE